MISVIIPAYNRAALLERAVNSVLEQSYRDVELIVVDDGSSEDLSSVWQLVETAGHRWLRTENRGPGAARNKGVGETTGEWIAFLDSDDVWLPEKLERQAAFLESHPEYSICQCKEVWFRNGRRVNPKAYHEMPDGEAFLPSLERCVVSPSSVMLRRELWEKAGGFDEDLFVCEDYDLWIRISSAHQIALVPEMLVQKYGGHQDQLSRRFPAMDRFRVYSLLKNLPSLELSEKQQLAMVAVLISKTQVLLVGAEKRSLPEVELYQQLLERLSSRTLDKLGGEQMLSEFRSLIARS